MSDSNIDLFDFDLAYSSGAYPIDYNGFLLNSSGTYDYLCENYPYNDARNSFAYIDSTEEEGCKKLDNQLYHSTVRFKVVADLKMGVS